jgi:hypothetical protein
MLQQSLTWQPASVRIGESSANLYIQEFSEPELAESDPGGTEYFQHLAVVTERERGNCGLDVWQRPRYQIDRRDWMQARDPSRMS